jgi:hypothetical protein
LVAGEKEANDGTVDIRTRDNERIGTKRIDELHNYFTSLLPAHSDKYEKFYENAWNPANFPTCAHDNATVEEVVEKTEAAEVKA